MVIERFQDGERKLMVCTLAEGETLRRMIHRRQANLGGTQVALLTPYGYCQARPWTLQQMPGYTMDETQSTKSLMQCLRFFNSEMHYSPQEVNWLRTYFDATNMNDREDFFMDLIVRRRRLKHDFEGTPVQQVFMTDADRQHINAITILSNLRKAKASRDKKPHVYTDPNQNDLWSQQQPDVFFAMMCQLGQPEGSPQLAADVAMLNEDGIRKTFAEFAAGELDAVAMTDIMNYVDQDKDQLISWAEFQEGFRIRNPPPPVIRKWMCQSQTCRTTEQGYDTETGLRNEYTEDIMQCPICNAAQTFEIVEVNASDPIYYPNVGMRWKCFDGPTCSATGGMLNTMNSQFCQLCNARRPG